MRWLWLLILLLFSQSSPIYGHTAESLIQKIDQLYRGKTSHAKMQMTIVTPNFTRQLKLEMWTEGQKKTFVVIHAPKKDKGVATLRRNKEMWNYFPKVNKVIKVPPSMMMGSWMNSDFTNDDLVKESTLLDDYQTTLEKRPHFYLLTLVPKQETASVWGKILIHVDKKTLLPVKQSYFDENGTQTRVMELSRLKTLGGRNIPTVMRMTNLKKKGKYTEFVYQSAEFDQRLPKGTFTLRNLKKKR